jgi:hypothetical protein
MERINAFPIFLLGHGVGVFLDRLETSSGWTFDALAREGYHCFQNLVHWASDTLVSSPLSKEAASQTVTRLWEVCSTDYLKEHGTEIVPEDVKSDIKFKLTHFTGVLSAELGSCDLYFISQKRGHNMKILIFAAERNLDESLMSVLSEQCIHEIREAGRCIAFDLPTAAGFHMFRAIETVVLMYFPILNLQPLDDRMRNLGNYIKLISGEKVDNQIVPADKKVDDKIIGMLNHLKDTYRNPLMHPELVLKDEEAQDLFQFGLSAVSTMVRDIMIRKESKEPERLEEEIT